VIKTGRGIVLPNISATEFERLNNQWRTDMSMYNALFGTNPYAKALLIILGNPDVPRFRDCYLNEEGEIVIYTRTGGGNREYYDEPNADNEEGPWNSTLWNIPGYLRDEDDDFDSTYAYFYFTPPKEFGDILEEIKKKQGSRNPSEAFDTLIKALTSDQDTPETRRAKEFGEKIFKAIEDNKTNIEI
jgi:hypothetical protein